jgi:predicted HTH domain antitoxin
MTIDLPDKEMSELRLTPAQARIELAAAFYARQLVTMGRGAKIAGISYTAFMHELGERGICINYTVDDALQDVETARRRLGQ